MFDKFKEECALIGVWNHLEAANMAYLGLYAQQHRGQEGAGVVSLSSGGRAEFAAHRGLGLVADVFHDFDFERLPGQSAIGHVRYTTAGSHHLANVQPFLAEIGIGKVALAHNGNLINAEKLRRDLIRDGAIFASTSDTEVILHLLAKGSAQVPVSETIIHAMEQVRGAFSIVLMMEDKLFAVRDPNGFRPLCLGSLDGGVVLASETCAFDLMDAEYERDIEPGEILEIGADGSMKSYFPFAVTDPSPCIFEYVYFARPDSWVFGQNVYPLRKRMGAELAKEHPVADADVVIPVPDSGVTAAIGYAHEAQLPLEYGLIRNHYVGRTFIEPKQSIRDFGVKIKLNANPEILRDKSVVVVDDSIVRGTTSKKLVKMIRQAGAREVHMRVSAPPTTGPCFYGIDTPQKEELIAAQKSVEEIAAYIGVDSLAYLSLEGLYRATERKVGKMCDACFTGNYPCGTPDKFSDRQTQLFTKD